MKKVNLFASFLLWIIGLAGIVWLVGCTHLEGAARSPAAVDPAMSQPVPRTEGPDSPASTWLEEAEQLYTQGAYAEALQLCLEVARINPDAPGLIHLRNRVLSAMLDQRTVQAALRDELDHRQAAVDTAERGHIPETFGLRRMVEEAGRDRLVPDSPMADALQQRVTIQLSGAALTTVIEALAEDEGINLIADQDIGAGRTVDINVIDVPLREVLAYIGRHFQIQFHTGENIIWITSTDPERAPPMETRVYRLRTGLQFDGLSWGDLPEDQRRQRDSISSLTQMATVLPSRISYMQQIIEQFVPSENGASLHVDFNTHTLFARNTPENLAIIEQIVDALDVNPPQILIEARFIEISQADLREIGIDWILGSPLTVTRRGVQEDGTWSRQPRTIIDEGSSITYQPYRSDASGTFPLGPQGAFGLLRDGNPPTANQGLNLNFRGVLTEPMFSAVIHALEISGRGRTLSVPRVTTINNNPAKLRDGDDLMFYEEFEAQAFHTLDRDDRRITLTALTPKGRPAVAELGFTLVAVPSVGADNRTISLLLTPTISELMEFISYQEDPLDSDQFERIRQVVVKLPRIARREVQTKVVVDSGETVVMGGLIRTVTQDTMRRVPVLGSLPLVGQLFRRSDVTEDRRNLIIFVTATVISERGESLIPVASLRDTPRMTNNP